MYLAKPSPLLPALLVCALVVSCGGSPPPPDDPTDWQLDTTSWPDCGWGEGTVVYGNLDGALRVRTLDSSVNYTLATNDELRTRMDLADGYYVPYDLTMSPDRRWFVVAMTWILGGRSKLFAVSCDGSIMQAFGTNRGEFNWHPKFSPDGRRLAFSRSWMPEGVAPGVFAVELATGRLTQLHTEGKTHDWFPDGRELLLSAYEPHPVTGTITLVLYGVDTVTGEHTVRASLGSPGLRFCIWVPALDAILCESGYIYRLGHPDEPTRMAPDSVSCFISDHPALGPDGAVYSSSGSDFTRLELGKCPGELMWNEDGSPEVLTFTF